MLTIENVKVSYGLLAAVSGVSLAVAESEWILLLGANGAGKTSLLRAIMGLVPHAGRVAMDARDISDFPAWKRHALGIGFVPEGRQVFAGMTVDENLRVGGYSRPAAGLRESLGRVYALFPRLAERRKQIANTMSGGEQQMLAIGRALMDEPRLLVVDEVSWGLSPLLVETVFESLILLRKSGVAILQAEQSAHMALQHADRVHVMTTGQIVLSDSASAFKDGSKLIENYIG